MAQYISKPGSKKLGLLHRREADLRRLLQKGTEPEASNEAAEAVRSAALAYYKAIGHHYDAKAWGWMMRSVESIVADYRPSDG